MSNIFERAVSIARSTTERVMGKDVTIFPVANKDPNAAPRLSQTDAPYTTSAVFYENTLIENDAKAQPVTGGGGKLVNRALQRQASIRIVEGQPLMAGYFMRRESDGAIFIISQFDADGLGTVLALVATVKALPEA
ncbi:hypothetical protein [Rhizobium sp. Nf11,1]|uniref:hypothetical protein n=1 Tax=Rhizobium sp. Nf11,1 TaxID=3404923 RepID=UPI003D34ACC5